MTLTILSLFFALWLWTASNALSAPTGYQTKDGFYYEAKPFKFEQKG